MRRKNAGKRQKDHRPEKTVLTVEDIQAVLESQSGSSRQKYSTAGRSREQLPFGETGICGAPAQAPMGQAAPGEGENLRAVPCRRGGRRPGRLPGRGKMASPWRRGEAASFQSRAAAAERARPTQGVRCLQRAEVSGN